MKKIIDFLKDWFTGEWTVKKILITMTVLFGVLFAIVTIFALSIHFLKILGAVLILGGAFGVYKRVSKGFKTKKATNIMLTCIFGIMAVVGVYFLFA